MSQKKSDNRKRRAVFFDRDGIINYRPVSDYVKHVEEFHFIPDFFDFFIKVKNLGYLAIIISNQQGIGKGLMSESDLHKIHSFMQKKVKEVTGHMFDDIYFCPELESVGSPHRKPNPGMILEAVEKWNIDIQDSWMIGDSINDIKAGINAGVKTIFIGDYKIADKFNPDQICKSLVQVDI